MATWPSDRVTKRWLRHYSNQDEELQELTRGFFPQWKAAKADETDWTPNRKLDWPKKKKKKPVTLSHPRRYLDGDRTKCPDCGASTKDPRILETIPCKVQPVVEDDEDEEEDEARLFSSSLMVTKESLESMGINGPAIIWDRLRREVQAHLDKEACTAVGNARSSTHPDALTDSTQFVLTVVGKPADST